MSLALDEARKSLKSEDVPIGAIIVNEDSEIISRGYNQVQKKRNPLMHAEIIALNKAIKKISIKFLHDYRLYVTLEPCPMCAGAILLSRIGKVIYGADDPKSGSIRTLYQILSDNRLNHKSDILSGVLADESSNLLKSFFKRLRQKKLWLLIMDYILSQPPLVI